MNFKFLLLLAVLAAGGYYWYSQNPGSFSSAGSSAVNSINGDVSRAEGKARHLR